MQWFILVRTQIIKVWSSFTKSNILLTWTIVLYTPVSYIKPKHFGDTDFTQFNV